MTRWGRATHRCVGKLTIIGSDNGLLPIQRQAIIWTNDGILLIGPLGTNFNEILIEILTFLFKNMRLKVSSGKWRPFCLGLNVLIRGHCCCINKSSSICRTLYMKRKQHGNISCTTSALWGASTDEYLWREPTCHQWIPLTLKPSNVDLWCLLCH